MLRKIRYEKSCNNSTNVLIFQKYNLDSQTVFEVDSDDEEILTVTNIIDDVIARRKFRKHENLVDKGAGGRRHSIC